MKFWLSLLLTTAALAQQPDLLEELYHKKQAAELHYVDKEQKHLYSIEFIKKLNLKQEDVLKSGTFFAVIPKGQNLYNINKDDAIEVTNREVVVRVFKQQDLLGHHLLLNNDGSVTYKAHNNSIQRIDNLLELAEPPHHYTPVVEKAVKIQRDPHFRLNHDFSFSFGSVSSNYTKDILNQSTLSMRAIHYDWTAYAQLNFPVQLGFMLEYQSLSGALDGGYNISDKTTYFGPAFKYHLTDWYQQQVHWVTKLKHSYQSTLSVSNADKSYDYRANKQALALGVQFEYKTELIGTLIYGFQYQRTWIKAKSDKYKLDIDRSNFYDDALLVNLGWQKDMIW